MKKSKLYWLLLNALLVLFLNDLSAQNPIIHTQFTADPSARVFNGKVYLYPSHDILAHDGKGRVGWFVMEDYHVYSTPDLMDWTDHGVIITQNKVPWVKPESYSMWAPDCIERNGKYYFYFPTTPADSSFGRGFAIGVAVADKPEGPYTPEAIPIKGVHGIDPNVFIDKDGQAYLYWSAGRIFGAKLKDNMVELASDPKDLGELPTVGLKEGPYLFERKGIYYLTFPHVQNKTERLEYAIGDNPLGPFKLTGVIMDESPNGCWTNHHSFIEFKNQWYLFYHQNDFSPRFDKNRSVRVDSMFFNSDGTIQKVIPTFRGVGLTPASKQIQVDRYSYKSQGASVDFLDTLNRFQGWAAILDTAGEWMQYNSVDFKTIKAKSVTARTLSPTGGTLQVRLDKPDGPVIATIKIPASTEWKTVSAPVSGIKPGNHHVVLQLKDNASVETDWISFK